MVVIDGAYFRGGGGLAWLRRGRRMASRWPRGRTGGGRREHTVDEIKDVAAEDGGETEGSPAGLRTSV